MTSKQTFIFVKDQGTDTQIQFDVAPLLKPGELLVSVSLGPVSPVSATTPLNVTQTSLPSVTPVTALLKAGVTNVSYGFNALITTNARVLSALIAVSVTDDVQVPYMTRDPQAYVDLIDTIEAGNAAVGSAMFPFPASVDPSGGFVNWEFLDASGVVYASGNAFDYQIQSDGFSNIVIAKSIINVPSSVPPSAANSKYQLRYTLELPAASIAQVDPTIAPNQNRFYSYENITVVGLNTVPLGTQDSVEVKGNRATMSIVLDRLYDTVIVQLVSDNVVIGQSQVTQFERVNGGYYFAASFDTSQLVESLVPYQVVWNYNNAVDPNTVYTESSALYVVTPSILQAISDVKAKINKARTTLYGTPDLLYPATTVLTWLRRGADAFNGGPGGFTSFTFTNAKGGIREYWLMYTEVAAIEAQYMAEGEKAFNFSGAAIQLDVDRTAFLDSAASKIQSRLDSEFKPFKQNLIIKGATQGDGSIDPSRLQQGAIGSVGITITPASPWGPYRTGLPYPTVFR